MIPPVTYQGGKGRLAERIVRAMNVPKDQPFYDFCCGSGAVSLALVEQGHLPTKIVMVDQGPWGMFYAAIGSGSFDLKRFSAFHNSVPDNPREIKKRIEALYAEPVGVDAVYVFLLLQAAAIGGAAIGIKDGRWVRSSGFRDYWTPTATSSRRSPVNPMMPMPDTILERITEIATKMRGIKGICADASTVEVERESVVYIDPPYSGTTSYLYNIDAVAVARSVPCSCWVSEGRALSEKAILLSDGRAKGGMTGQRKKSANEEWLSLFVKTREEWLEEAA